MIFPKDFKWGAGSASYQIEGGAFEDGKGLSIWDVFSHKPGTIADGHNGDVACDAYHRFEEDLDIMKSLGISNYKFSISWPRVIPDGKGSVSESGLDYYDRLVDGCIKRGIEPWMTLYHWDLPQALEEAGGWRNRETAYIFRDFVQIVASHFKGRVKHYITINEPQICVGLGYAAGVHAPGLKLSHDQVFECWHNVLLAHGLSTAAIRAVDSKATVGLSSTGALCYIKDHRNDIPPQLAKATFSTLDEGNSFFNHQWFLDPVCLGKYPDDPGSPWFGPSLKVRQDDLDIINEIPDFIGLNIYNGTELDPSSGYSVLPKYPGYPRTSLKWPVTPEVMYWGCKQIYDRYGIPLAITENGQGCHDRIYRDGKVHDADRIDFLASYIEELGHAIAEGVPVLGYFHWSLTDNLEWHSGYDDRFGLVYIDYRTQERILKDSAYWYADVVASNGENLD